MNKKVKTVTLAVEKRTTFDLNKIEFDDGYIALERAAPNSGLTLFKEGDEVQMNITHPGMNGKLDWIVFVSSTSQPEKVNPDGIREYIYISQQALLSAVTFHSGSTCTKADILQTAGEFSEFIYNNAKNLCKKYCLTK